LIAGLIILLAAGLSYAAEDGWAPGSAYNSRFDPGTVETVSGELVKLDLFLPKGMSPGVQLIIRAGNETIPVQLGPLWFMKNQKREVAPGDKLEVTGSRVDSGGKPAIIASMIKKGGKSLKLRDERGVPVWAGEKK